MRFSWARNDGYCPINMIKRRVANEPDIGNFAGSVKSLFLKTSYYGNMHRIL